MGQEAVCTVRFAGQVSTGKALLETQELIFRGDFRVRIPLAAIQSLQVQDGVLIVVWPEGIAEFDLGPIAIKWDNKIRNPKSLVEKLGVKPNHRVGIVGKMEDSFLSDLRKRTDQIEEDAAKNADLVFIRCDRASDLRRISSVRKRIKPDGGIWIVYPKGHKSITQSAVFTSGKKAGLVDIKVASFSETHTALKFVIPKKKR